MSEDAAWYDDDAGSLVRPYVVTDGRTEASQDLDSMAMVRSAFLIDTPSLPLYHAEVYALCGTATAIVEIAARLRLPALSVKVLVADLIDWRMMSVRRPDLSADPRDKRVLEAVIRGLRDL